MSFGVASPSGIDLKSDDDVFPQAATGLLGGQE
jgi:hypothetical protein